MPLFVRSTLPLVLMTTVPTLLVPAARPGVAPAMTRAVALLIASRGADAEVSMAEVGTVAGAISARAADRTHVAADAVPAADEGVGVDDERAVAGGVAAEVAGKADRAAVGGADRTVVDEQARAAVVGVDVDVKVADPVGEVSVVGQDRPVVDHA
jgi:hypothetical protein